MTYIPRARDWSIVGQPMKPKYFALRVRSQGEKKAKADLKMAGIHSCYPTEERKFTALGRVRKKNVPSVPGVIYAKFNRVPMWHNLKERGIITGVFCRNNIPLILSSEMIRAAMGITTVAEQLEAERREAMRIKPGDMALMLSGPLAGLAVDVRATQEGKVLWSHISGLKGSTDANNMEKVLNK